MHMSLQKWLELKVELEGAEDFENPIEPGTQVSEMSSPMDSADFIGRLEELDTPSSVVSESIENPISDSNSDEAKSSLNQESASHTLPDEQIEVADALTHDVEAVELGANSEITYIGDDVNLDKMSTSIVQSKIQELESLRVSLANEIRAIKKLSEDLEAEIELHVSVREDLNQWITERKESFAWKLTDKLRIFEKELSKDEINLQEFSNNEPILDFEFGAKTRRWVMKSIAIPGFVIVGLIMLMEILRSNSGFTNFPDPANPAVNIPVNNVDLWLDKNLGLNHQQIIVWLIALFLVIFIGMLFAHFKKTSEFRQIVAIEAQLTKQMEESVHNVKHERERLDSLHPQVPQILELLSLGLHTPWEIDPKYLSFEGQMPDASRIPESLDISVPTLKSSSKVFPQLVLRALNQVQQPGWREVAFERAIQRLSESAGFGESNSALRELDQDHRRSGKRQMLIGLEDKSEILRQIGDELVREFASIVQEKVLPHAQPDVISLRPDALAHLLLRDNLVADSEENVSAWEIRLAEIAQAGSPWSPSTFSARGQMAARHEKKPESVFIASDRAAQHANKEVAAFREVFSGTRPFEVSIRVDLSEWCHPEELAIFQDYQPSEEELQERSKKESALKSVIEVATEGQENVAF